MKFIALILLLAVIGGGAYLYSKRPSQAPENALNTENASAPKVEVKQTDLESGSKLPAGFPSGIPVETANVKESYSAYYKNLNATEYSLSFISSKTSSALWDTYSSYMSQNGFVIDTNASSKSTGQITGKKNNDTLSVIITTHSGTTLVQLSFLDRP